MKNSWKPKGNCFQIAGNLVIDNHDFRLCHGIVAGQGDLEGYWISHAWVELNGLVFDFSNGKQRVLPKEKYYEIGKITKVKKYDWIKASKLMLKTNHYGPWERGFDLEKPVKIISSF